MRNVLPETGAKEQADSLDEEEVAIVMEIAEVIERSRKDKLPALRNVPKKKLLEETAKVNKVFSNFRHWGRLERKYSIRVKRLNVVIEELKQRITAVAAKVRRYQGRVDS